MSLLAFTDQEYDGTYLSSYLVPEYPKKDKQRYDISKSRFTGVHISSYRRNKSHRSLATFNTKKGGPSKDNISDMKGSFLELDGSPNTPLKTNNDVLDKCRETNLPTPTYIIQTSPGHFHVIWIYDLPLSWNAKNERWWTAQQKRLIEVFQDFGPDVGACLNPVQFLRNPTQLNAFNFKRKCEVEIHSTKYKTSLGSLTKRLYATGIKNERVSAETIIRQDLRCSKFICETQKHWGQRLGLSERTMNRLIPKLIKQGSLKIVKACGNNKGITRINTYKSLIYIEPYLEQSESENLAQNYDSSELPCLERSKTSLLQSEHLLQSFNENGAEIGIRNKTIFVCGLYLKWKSNGKITMEQLYEALLSGYLKSSLSESEYMRTLKNVLKDKYDHYFSSRKLIEWGLVENEDYSKNICDMN